jgi:putative ABC transport system permease protein
MPNWGFVWMVAWPDFRVRLVRFVIIGFGMALVLAITLLLSAFSEGFKLRSERLLDVFGGDRYLIAEGSAGPMTSTTPLPGELVDLVESQGMTALPLVLTPNAVAVDGAPAGVIVVGASGSEPGLTLTDGRWFEQPGEAIVDAELVELSLGDDFILAGRPMTVVGTTEHVTWDIATAGLIIDQQEALDIFADGADIVTAVAFSGDQPITGLPPGVVEVDRASAFDDVLSRTADAKRSIDSFKMTLWVLAVVIVAAVLYLAAIDRVRDFAVFKATGASNTDLVVGLSLQAVFVGLIAGVLSIGLAHVMKPVYPGLLSLPLSVAWTVVPVAVVISVVSSLFGVRRAINADPSQAFG